MSLLRGVFAGFVEQLGEHLTPCEIGTCTKYAPKTKCAECERACCVDHMLIKPVLIPQPQPRVLCPECAFELFPELFSWAEDDDEEDT